MDKLIGEDILKKAGERIQRLRMITRTHEYCAGVNECADIFWDLLSSKESDNG